MTITSCLLALFLRLSCEKHMKGLEFLQVKERTAACAESAEAAGQLSPLSLALEKERKKNRKISEKIRKINQEKILGDLIFNPRPVCCFEKDQKSSHKLYLGEEDQLRPSNPLVHLGKLWSLTSVRGRVKLEVSSPVHSVSWSIQPCSSGNQVLSKPVSRLFF
ncbi:hypothetical protein IGI04_035473, partial [Brassica rapa subsp. trilocularis]